MLSSSGILGDIQIQDWKYFVASVKGGICISGRRCYEELGEAMPGSSTLGLSLTRGYKVRRRSADMDLQDALR